MKWPPLQEIVERGAGSSVLACGHIASTPKNRNTRRVRCPGCLNLADRLAWLKRNPL